MYPRSIFLTLVLLAADVVATLALRMAPLGIQPFVVRYCCAMVWALMLYWIVSAILPSMQLFLVALLTGVLATSIEYLKLVHESRVETFLGNLPFLLLPSPIFDRWAILAYWLIVCIAASVDAGTRFRPRRRPW
jgi:hypothetical protein